MSDIPICRLCECVPSESFDLIDIETMYYNCDTSGCPVAESGMMLTPEQWQQLMGGGEPVMKYTNSPTQCHVEWEKLPYGTHLLYTRPQAAQVDDAVVLDAALFRWLIDGPRSGPVWNNVLTEEQRYGHCDIRAAIIAAMKGGG